MPNDGIPPADMTPPCTVRLSGAEHKSVRERKVNVVVSAITII